MPLALFDGPSPHIIQTSLYFFFNYFLSQSSSSCAYNVYVHISNKTRNSPLKRLVSPAAFVRLGCEYAENEASTRKKNKKKRKREIYRSMMAFLKQHFCDARECLRRVLQRRQDDKMQVYLVSVCSTARQERNYRNYTYMYTRVWCKTRNKYSDST